ncbi:MAG: phosphatidylglycerophosphatase A [Opitutaceae bacterium]|nr:phosphatidylglycerophosphatase A [Opitutaceae bacterium]
MKLEQPDWPHLLPARIVVNVATLGPLGQRLPAPGTWGSVAGLAYFTVFFMNLGWVGTLLLGVAGIYVAIAFTGEAESRLGRRDPAEVILDEFVAMPLCYLGWTALPPSWPHWFVFLAGLGLFRFFDIIKPLGIRRLQKWPAGWGVVADDVAAALAACLTLHLAAWAWSLR